MKERPNPGAEDTKPETCYSCGEPIGDDEAFECERCECILHYECSSDGMCECCRDDCNR